MEKKIKNTTEVETKIKTKIRTRIAITISTTIIMIHCSARGFNS